MDVSTRWINNLVRGHSLFDSSPEGTQGEEPAAAVYNVEMVNDRDTDAQTYMTLRTDQKAASITAHISENCRRRTRSGTHFGSMACSPRNDINTGAPVINSSEAYVVVISTTGRCHQPFISPAAY